MRRLRAYAHAARSLAADWTHRPRPVEQMGESALRDAFAAFDADTVVVYVGLSDVAETVDGDPYEALRDALFSQFDAVLTPGFTFSFRDTGFVDLDRASPEVGAFGRRFLSDADLRTDDPVFSLLAAGRFAFSTDGTDCSYADGGYWTELHDRNVLYLNVGTGRFRCSAFHVAEHRHDVPYVSLTEHRGVVRRDGTARDVTHLAPTDDHYRRFARRKVTTELGDRLVDRSIGGLRIQGCRASAIDALLDDRLASDPYYLVT